MPVITLPDGSERTFDHPVTAMAVAESIGAGLAKAVLAAKVDGELVDLSHDITQDSTLSLVTAKDEEALEVIRHSSAHLMAQAVQALFKNVQVTIGPVIDNGFYYDFATDSPFSEDDFSRIEDKMQELVKANLPVVRREVTRDEAIALFAQMGEDYKVQIIRDIPEDQVLSLYQQGDFVDLCRGPHVPSTGKLGAFKLMKVAGAYWRGDSNNAMLQRLYGTAWPHKKALKAYLTRLEEAEKRDHRKLAIPMGLFHFQQEAPGMCFWHPNGWTLNKTIRQYISDEIMSAGYQEINTPQLVDSSLWEQSGHTSKFDDDMFTTHSENREYMVKPMSCPCHVQVFKQGLKSYRDLPIRYAEYGSCHRNEPSGTLHGLMRVRGFVQDDGHVFCREDQVLAEVVSFIKQVHDVYGAFGFDEIDIKLSTRPEKRLGTDEQWDKTEKMLEDALNEAGVKWAFYPGEGAFYGPKLEFSLTDSIGRVWQCGTIQIDSCTAERLGATYVTKSGDREPPIMLHRAILGSLERFIAILIESYGGKLPLWLAPVQVVICNISDAQADFCRDLANKLQINGFKVNLDLRNEKIGFKIREHILAKVPYQLIVGDKELESQVFALRAIDGAQSEPMTLEALFDYLQAEVAQKRRNEGD